MTNSIISVQNRNVYRQIVKIARHLLCTLSDKRKNEMKMTSCSRIGGVLVEDWWSISGGLVQD